MHASIRRGMLSTSTWMRSNGMAFHADFTTFSSSIRVLDFFLPVIHCPLDILPQVFNWVEVWALGRPWKELQATCLSSGCRDFGSVGTRIVFLKDTIALRENLPHGGERISAEGSYVCSSSHTTVQCHQRTQPLV